MKQIKPNITIIILSRNITEEMIKEKRNELCGALTEVVFVAEPLQFDVLTYSKLGETDNSCQQFFTCGSLNEAISKSKGEYLTILNCDSNVSYTFYQRLYDSACFNQADVAKGRLNRVYRDGHIVRTNLNRTISAGIQERKQLVNLFDSEWYTAIFKTEICKNVANEFPKLESEQLGSYYKTIIQNIPVSRFCLAQDAVFEEKCADAQSMLHIDISGTNNNKHIHICAICDNGYAIPTIVMLTSIKHNKNNDTKISVHLIMHCVDAYLIDSILALSSEDFEIKLYEKNAQKFIDAGLAKVKHIPPFNLIRFDVCDILNDVDKVLYLDGDIIVRSDLRNLYNIDLDDNLIAAVRDLPGERDRKHHLQMNADYYINSGVMLMNLREMRNRRIPDLLLESRIHRHPSWKLQDQDVFNYVCRKKVVALHPRYNAMVPSYIIWHDVQSVNLFYDTAYSSFAEMLDDAVIVHLCGIKERRPWIVSNGMYSDVWDRYYSLSPLSHIELNRTLWLPQKKNVESGQNNVNVSQQQRKSDVASPPAVTRSLFWRVSPHKKELRILGIPVWSKNTRTGRKITRLFGIKVRHKKMTKKC